MHTLTEALQLAIHLHEQGNLREAEVIYRGILDVEPAHPDSLYLLGRIELQRGAPDAAADWFRRAIAAEPTEPTFHDFLGEAYRAARQWQQAAAAYREAIRLKPDYTAALSHWALTLEMLGQPDDALAMYRRVLEHDPAFAAAYCNMAVLLRQMHRHAEAQACLTEAIRLKPDFVEAYNNLGNNYRDQGQYKEALDAYQNALRLDSNYGRAHFNQGNVLRQMGRASEALESFRRAVAVDPRDGQALVNISWLLHEAGDLDAACDACHDALRIDATLDAAHCNLGVCLQELGHLPEAIACFRKAVELNPTNAGQHSNLLYALNFSPDISPELSWAEHQAWGARHADPLEDQTPHANNITPVRRLRIGYVSPHFRDHAVQRFFEPLLLAHDSDLVETVCYSDVPAPMQDAVTQRLRGSAAKWRDIAGWSDAQVASLIRDDQIDILVDLTGHLGGNRLLAFARRPAPVQMTYLGYQATTGMRAMDFRWTDAWSDPPGLTDRWYTETLCRLPRSFFCYQPTSDAPPIVPLPAQANGYVTFGSFNNFAKVTPRVLEAWAEILRGMPTAKLLLLVPKSARLADRLREFFQARGITDDRVELCLRRPHRDYLELINRVDLALDPFPFNGHTTVCDALWQGVPSVVRVGECYASRFGARALETLGLREFIAHDESKYTAAALRLAGEKDRLANLRNELRAMMSTSCLLDARGFAVDVEIMYQAIWQQWCERHAPSVQQ